MGSVVIIFLPILLPYLLICAVAGNFGYDPLDVLFGPFELALNGIIEVFFGGSQESFFGFLDVGFDKIMSFLTENEDAIGATVEKIADLIGMIL